MGLDCEACEREARKAEIRPLEHSEADLIRFMEQKKLEVASCMAVPRHTAGSNACGHQYRFYRDRLRAAEKLGSEKND